MLGHLAIGSLRIFPSHGAGIALIVAFTKFIGSAHQGGNFEINSRVKIFLEIAGNDCGAL
jgi:hypothetical protein